MIRIVNVLGLNVFSDDLMSISLDKKNLLLNTISPNSYGISTKDLKFQKSLKNSDYLVLDGTYFALASILLNRTNIKKNQGPDVFYHFMERINSQNGKVFFLGSSEKTLNKIKEKAAIDYPFLETGFFSPPYKAEFSSEDTQRMINAVNEFKPDVLFIGMTCPKQEKWAYENKNEMESNLICCIGAVFDWYAGNEKRISPIWWKLRLAWLIRTIHRPEILKRYPNIGIFFWHLLLALLGFKKYKNGKI
ncbi:WecB/TagA/CpsF family glycosyltransferase [uncultured Draconibacterium sp.]|uniref:WecB/TagA/CpsF family glycosyltransferase n=1 Tax=uncultured Draconibacterium sp. TaxID=1573823 RepID=UPI003216D8ED